MTAINSVGALFRFLRFGATVADKYVRVRVTV